MFKISHGDKNIWVTTYCHTTLQYQNNYKRVEAEWQIAMEKKKWIMYDNANQWR
jgi:hypothetical protein